MATLVFDRNCPYCTAIALVAEKTSNLDRIPFQSEEAQKKLKEAFEDPGFTLFLFEDEKVFWGREAARRVAEKSFIPGFIAWPGIRFYPELRKLFSFLSDRAEVREPVCETQSCVVNHKDGGIKVLN